MANRHWEQNKEATIYVGNLDERFGEALMWEMMTQMGPVVNLHMPMDRVSRTHQGYGFVEFDSPESADYAARALNGIRVYGKVIRVNKASADKQRAAEIGAELFVNNLDPQVDEKILFDTFSRFGQLVTPPNVVRDANNISKGYGFVNFDSFEASDQARDTMNGQYLLSKQITVEYAYKKDGKGERHGDAAERKLAAEGKKHNIVPEQQPLPPAFLMTAPPPTTPATPTGPASAGPGGPASGVPGFEPGGAGRPVGVPTGPGGPPPMGPPGGIPQGYAPPPISVHGVPIPPRPGPSPGFGGPPHHNNNHPHPHHGAPIHHMGPPGGTGAGGRMGGGPPMPPPMGLGGPGPSGLPARPPPSQGAFGMLPPNDFHPAGGPLGGPGGFRGGPPGAPSPGFVPPPGYAPPNGGPPMPIPAGFMNPPPPGFPGRH